MSSRLLVVKVFCYGVICFLCQVTLSDCEVTLVTRNVTDSFRIGQDGCLNDTSICNGYQASCQNDGSCLCNKNTPHFRNPVILHSGGSLVYGSSYGCIDKMAISHRVGKISCKFSPYQVIPNDHKETATEFSKKEPKVKSCTFESFEAKFPNSNSRMDINWLNKDYVQINISTNILYFKWRKSVSKLEASIITIAMNCILLQTQHSTECLQAKVLGTWRSSGNKGDVPHSTTTMFPSDIFSVSPTHNVPTNTMYSSSITSGNAKKSSSHGISGSTIAAAVAVPLIVLIIILVVILLIKRRIFKRSVSKRNDGIGHVNTGMTYQNKKRQATTGNSEYAKPSIDRVMVNGDVYAVANKKKPMGKDTQDGKSPNVLLNSKYAEPDRENKTSEKPKQELNYMDPENLGLANNATPDSEQPSQTTEYASIVGVMQNN